MPLAVTLAPRRARAAVLLALERCKELQRSYRYETAGEIASHPALGSTCTESTASASASNSTKNAVFAATLLPKNSTSGPSIFYTSGEKRGNLGARLSSPVGGRESGISQRRFNDDISNGGRRGLRALRRFAEGRRPGRRHYSLIVT